MKAVRHRWVDVIGAAVALGVAAAMLYALLPSRTLPGQQVVPPVDLATADPAQVFLTIFIVMTALGAPVTLAIVLALVLRKVSRMLPASSAVAPDTGPKGNSDFRLAPAKPEPGPLSKGQERLWKIIATILLLLVGAAAAVGGAAWFVSMLPK